MEVMMNKALLLSITIMNIECKIRQFDDNAAEMYGETNRGRCN